MIRIQVLELPAVQIGDKYETPYVLVLSGVSAQFEEDLSRTDVVAGIKAATGARGLLTFPDEDVQVG